MRWEECEARFDQGMPPCCDSCFHSEVILGKLDSEGGPEAESEDGEA